MCGSKKRLQVHHIIRVADSYNSWLDPLNGILLCFVCHGLVTGNERYFQETLRELVELSIIKNDKKKKR